MLGPLKILLLLLLVVLLFGAGRVPVMMENIAKGIRNFKEGLADEEGEIISERKSAADKKSGD